MAEEGDGYDESINLLRKTWEIEDHWVLRRDFLLVHKDKFPPERLLCLAQVFVNMETLGNQYDEELMEEVKELAYQIPSLRSFREKQQQLVNNDKFKPPNKMKKTSSAPGLGTRNVSSTAYSNFQTNYQQPRGNQRNERYDSFSQQYQQPQYGRAAASNPSSPTYGRSSYGQQQPAYGRQQQQYNQSQQSSQNAYQSLMRGGGFGSSSSPSPAYGRRSQQQQSHQGYNSYGGYQQQQQTQSAYGRPQYGRQAQQDNQQQSGNRGGHGSRGGYHPYGRR